MELCRLSKVFLSETRRKFWIGKCGNNRRQLHNENFHDSYFLSQISKIEMGGKYGPSCEKKSACSVLGGKPEGKRPLGTQSVDGSGMLVRVLEL